jgi:CDP-diglyceride synthetase
MKPAQDGEFRNRTRAVTVVSLVGAILLFLWWTPEFIFNLAVVAVVVLATHEFYAMLSVANDNTTYRSAGLLGAAGLTLQMAVLPSVTLGVSIAFFLMLVLSTAALRTTRPSRDELEELLVVLFGALYVAAMTGQLIYIRASDHGRELVAVLILTVFTRETGAHFAGLLFPGRRALNSSINANKSYVGAVLGAATATTAAVALSRYLNVGFTIFQAVTFGACLGAACQFGDLSESYLKRVAGRRHSGKLLGPEGGLLDFLDAAAFAIVMARLLLLVWTDRK